jgi:hypothetical protein
MYPTLKPLDVCEVIPPSDKKLRPGDIILFPQQTGQPPTVHRIIKHVENGFITKGDNNQAIDQGVVGPENIIGQVVSIHRGHKTIRLDLHPLWRARLLFQKTLIALYSRVSQHACPVLLTKSAALAKILAGWFEPWLSLRVVRYNSPRGTIARLVAGKLLVGEYDRTTQRWMIKAGYRLFVDERKYRC